MESKKIKSLSKEEKRVLFLKTAASSSAIEGDHAAAKKIRRDAQLLENEIKKTEEKQ